MAATVSLSKSEKSYIQSALETVPPLREDGRALHDFRAVLLATGVAPLANGSARVNIGKSPEQGGGGAEVLAATKLEVESVENGDGQDGGRIACTVTWYAYNGPCTFLAKLSASKKAPQLPTQSCPQTHWTICSSTTRQH